MTVISANLVKDLREKTGAGMMDCKKALIESAGNFEAAADWLRQKGLAAAAKKSSRIASEGVIAVSVSGTTGAVLELNSETDFVAKNDTFQALANNLVAEYLTKASDFESFRTHALPTGRNVTEEVAEHVAVIGENISLRRAQKLSVGKGAVVSYIHNQIIPGLGKIGVLVALESELAADKLQALGKQIAMHVAAVKPESLQVADLDPALIEKERNFLIEQARSSGKPENVIEKMIEGRIAKFYEQVVLLEQLFVMDGKTKVADFVAQTAKELGGQINVTGFIRYAVGEGIEKQEADFAAEVAAMAAGGR
jgi:elongation factor Ts